MKVLICIPCLLTGGTEIQTLNLVKSLIQGKHQVSTICYFEYLPEMVSRYQEAGSKVICLSTRKERITGKAGIIFLYKGLKQVIQTEKPDIAHVQYMAPGAIPIILLRFLGIKNIITTSHTVADIYSNLKIVHFIQKYCVRAFTCITQTAEISFFGNSNLYTQKTVLKKRNHFTIYNALPPYIQIREEKKRFSSPITLGVVSQLEKIKGMDLVIPVFAKIKEKYPEIRLLIVGDGSQKELMQQQAKKLVSNNNIIWMGRQEPENLQTYYDQIDILLMPSRSEGFGLVAIEGMARGCVIVASNTGGLSEVVIDKKVGLLHQKENTSDMIEKIHHLLENPQTIEIYSQKAQNYVKRFSYEQYAQLFNHLYTRIIN